MREKITKSTIGKIVLIIAAVLVAVLLICLVQVILQYKKNLKVEMPDFQNKTKEEAIELLDGYNFNVSYVEA